MDATLEQLAYLTEPLKWEFMARVAQKTVLPSGQVEVILEKTWFYPTGGGQEHDTGVMGQASVLEVFKNEAGIPVHRLDQDIAGPVAPARIDGRRRLAHMQHHSAQHILSAALETTLGLETLSAHISADSPSTIDVPFAVLRQADLDRVEGVANDVVFENRAIKSSVVTDADLPAIPFRRAPKVSGQIRLVEVDGFDYSACGGTHCPYTGMIGLIKIVKTESQNQKLRLSFVAGGRALAYMQEYQAIVGAACRHFNVGPADVPAALAHQAQQLQAAQQTVKTLTAERLSLESQHLLACAKPFAGGRLVTALLPDRSAKEVAALAKLLAQADVVALLAGYDGQKLALVVSCGEKTGLNALAILQKQLAHVGARGGGNAALAQGGGPALPEQAAAFFDRLEI